MALRSVEEVAEVLNACVNHAWSTGQSPDEALQPIVEALQSGVNLAAVLVHDQMKAVLVAEEDKLRAQATSVLAKLFAVRGLALPVDTCRHLCTFFSARLGDFPSVPGALDALANIVRYHNSDSARPCVDPNDMFESIFSQLHVPGLGQAIRQRVFTLMKVTLAHENLVRALSEQEDEFLSGAISCMEGERDPRCLLQCFELVTAFYACFSSAIPLFAERIYDVTACYFPLSFVPPPNDPYGIKPEELSQSLENALCSHASLLEFSIPFFVDKLSSTVVLAKQDSLKALYHCTTKYSIEHFSPHMDALGRELYLNATGGANSEITEMTNKVITALGKLLRGDDWKVFAVCIVDPCAKEVCRNMDGIMGRASMTSLVAVAKSGAEPFRYVLNSVMPALLARLRDVHTALQMELTRQTKTTIDPSLSSTALQFISELLECVDPAVDLKMHARGSPMEPFAAELVLLLRALLTDVVLHASDSSSLSGTGANAQKTAKIVELCVGCATKLLTRPPSPLVPHADSKHVITSLCSMALAAPLAPAIHEAALEALVLLARSDEVFRAEVSTQIIEPQLASLTNEAAAQKEVAPQTVKTLSKLLMDRATLAAHITSMIEALLANAPQGPEMLASGVNVAILAILESTMQGLADDTSILELLAGPSTDDQPSLISRVVQGLRRAVISSNEPSELLGAMMGKVAAITREALSAAYGEIHDQLAIQVLEAVSISNVDDFSPSMLRMVLAVVTVLDKQSRLFVEMEWIDKTLAVAWPYAVTQPAEGSSSASNTTNFVEAAQQIIALVLNKASKDHLEVIVERVRADVTNHVVTASTVDSELKCRISLLVWILKALAMRPDAATHSNELVQRVIQLFTDAQGNNAQIADHIAYAVQDILPDDELVLTATGRCRISLLWKQRFFSQLFKPLFEAFQSNRASSRMACLVVLCTVSGIVPKAVLSSDIESVSAVVIQAMASLNNTAGHDVTPQQREALTSRALQTLVVLLEHSRETVVLHLKTILPVLLLSAQSASTALSRSAAVNCLLELSKLTYAVLHPHKQMVLNGLKIVVDDKKKGVRRLAAKARNEWAVVGTIA